MMWNGGPQQMKITTIIGTRPEAIKMAPVLEQLRGSRSLESIVCVTSQHTLLLQQMLEEFGIVPDYAVDGNRPAGDTVELIGWLVTGLDKILGEDKPDLVLVQGDTASVLAGAVAATTLGIPIGHLEAGLRTGDLRSPFPEELIRSAVSRVARYHFVNTPDASANLLREGVPKHRIFITGSTVVDALRRGRAVIANWGSEESRLHYGRKLAARLQNSERRLILVTGHRRENLSWRLGEVCSAVATLAKDNPDWDFVFPVHLNPLVQCQVRPTLEALDNVFLQPPLAYHAFVHLMTLADLILTDSGGIQEEAPYLGVPVLVTRDVTDRPESVRAGYAQLVSGDAPAIQRAVKNSLAHRDSGAKLVPTTDLYGDGRAAQRVVRMLEQIAEQGGLFPTPSRRPFKKAGVEGLLHANVRFQEGN